MTHEIDKLLDRLNKAKADVFDLLQGHQTKKDEKYWRQDPRLYRGFAKKLISAGHPTRAVELVREGMAYHPNDLDLKYFLALAFARGGNMVQARRYLDDLLKVPDLEPRLKVEVFSLEGRYFKDCYARTNDPARKTDFAEKSAACYLRAYRISGDLFPLINAATMSLLAGRIKQARDLAGTALRQAKAELRKPGKDQDYWLWATLAEAHLIHGDPKKVKERILQAVRLAGDNVGDIASMRRNLLLLKDTVGVSETIWGIFNVGSVVAFAGHMIDHPRRAHSAAGGRFPADAALERRVSELIREKLANLNATVGYGSAACGSDILFAERMLERGAELHIVLPFHKDDFYYTSVDFGYAEMAGWRARCDAVLARAKQVHYATTEHYLGDDVLFAFVNTFTQGLALTRAAERGVEAHALVLLDPWSSPAVGGTGYFLEMWKKHGRPYEVIDLAAARSEVGAHAFRFAQKADRPPVTVKESPIKRRIKVMLFADVKGFSRLADEHLRPFFFHFLNEVTSVLRELPAKPDFCNTWGDGLFVVFDKVVEGADFALRLLKQLEKVNWAELEMPEALALRVGLHAGPVYRHKDPIIGRHNYFGSHVNRAARIEPVTTPGCAFASEQFAAALAVEQNHDFVCEFVGIEDLAKGYDRCPLYRLERR